MLHRNLRIGDLIYDFSKRKIITVNINILDEISNNEENDKFRRIPINSKWLKEVFKFESKYLAMQYMTIYTSKINSFKVHEQHGGFSLSCVFRDKIKNELGEGVYVGKPKIVYVDELMAYLKLLRNQDFYFEDRLDELNELFIEYSKN